MQLSSTSAGSQDCSVTIGAMATTVVAADEDCNQAAEVLVADTGTPHLDSGSDDVVSLMVLHERIVDCNTDAALVVQIPSAGCVRDLPIVRLVGDLPSDVCHFCSLSFRPDHNSKFGSIGVQLLMFADSFDGCLQIISRNHGNQILAARGLMVHTHYFCLPDHSILL